MFQDGEERSLQIGRSQQVKRARFQHIQPFPFTGGSGKDDDGQVRKLESHLLDDLSPTARTQRGFAEQRVVTGLAQPFSQLVKVSDPGELGMRS